MKRILLITGLALSIGAAKGQLKHDGTGKPLNNNTVQAVVKNQNYYQANCDTFFYDGLEAGNTSNWTVINGAANAITTAPANGTYCMELTGQTGNHYDGSMRLFPNIQPNSMEYNAKSFNSTQAVSYFVIGDDNVSSNNGMVFIYFYQGTIRVIGNSTYQYSFNQGQWYNIRIDNIDWTGKTFDVYIDNVLQVTGMGFRAPVTANITTLHLYSFHAGNNSYYDDILIKADDGPVPSLSVTDVLCNGANNGSINNSVTGGVSPYTYAWSNGATSQNITSLSPGTYTVTVTDDNGCTATTSATVNEPTALVNTLNATDVNCNGGNDGSIANTVAGGTPGYTYLWSNGATTQNASNLVSGTYAVTVTDANGCTTTSSATVNEPTVLVVTKDSTVHVSCNGGANGGSYISVSGGTPGYTYAWSNGGTTQDLTSVGANVYSVTVTDNNGCTAIAVDTINEPSVLSIVGDSISNLVCNGDSSGAINTTSSGGTPNYTYSWSSGQTSDDISGLLAGSYTITTTDNNGCTQVSSFTLTEPTALTATVDSTIDLLCNGDTIGAAYITASGGTPNYTYSWSNGATTEDIVNVSGGSYLVTVTDNNGCVTIDTATVIEPTVIASVIDSTTGILCNGDTTGSIYTSTNGGTPGYTYNWNTGDTTAILSNVNAGSYMLTVTDSNGCTEVFTHDLVEPDTIAGTGNVSNETVNGNDGAIDLTATGGTPGYTYNWSTTDTTEDVSGLAGGTYTVTITDANGCTEVIEFTVSSAVGINEQVVENQIKLFPNPAKDEVTVVLNKPEQISMHNALGKQVLSIQTTSTNTNINLSDFAAGIYYLQVGKQVKKLVIQ